MENLTNLAQQIIQQTEKDKDKLQQISEFDETLKMLEGLMVLEKSTYSFPMIDTLGKQTYSNLNSKAIQIKI